MEKCVRGVRFDEQGKRRRKEEGGKNEGGSQKANGRGGKKRDKNGREICGGGDARKRKMAGVAAEDGVKVAFANVQSVVNKVDELRAMVDTRWNRERNLKY